MTIKDIRTKKKLTQQEAADLLGLSLRTYQNYELEVSKRDKLKIDYIKKTLSEYERITPNKGILSFEEIKDVVYNVFKDTDVSYVYLFGSYATNNATAISDVDLLVSNEIKGLKYVGIYEELTNNMHKKIDLIRIDDLIMNFDFLNEVLRNGIKIYERREEWWVLFKKDFKVY